MRRRIITLVLAAALLAVSTGAASAQADRACFGEFVSFIAQNAGGVGQFDRVLAKELRPYGQVVSQMAQDCP